MSKFPIPSELTELIEKLVIIEEEKKRKAKEQEDHREPLYDYEEYEPRKKEEPKPTKIEISLE